MDAVYLPEYFRGIFSAFISLNVLSSPIGFAHRIQEHLRTRSLIALPVITCERLPPAGPLFGVIVVSFITSLILSGESPSGRRASWHVPKDPMSASWPWSSQETYRTTPSGVSSTIASDESGSVKTTSVYADGYSDAFLHFGCGFLFRSF